VREVRASARVRRRAARTGRRYDARGQRYAQWNETRGRQQAGAPTVLRVDIVRGNRYATMLKKANARRSSATARNVDIKEVGG